jgi:hypothetical protein
MDKENGKRKRSTSKREGRESEDRGTTARGERTGIGWKEKKEGAGYDSEKIEHMWSGCGEMRERARKEEEGKNREGEGWEIRIKMLYLQFFFLELLLL